MWGFEVRDQRDVWQRSGQQFGSIAAAADAAARFMAVCADQNLFVEVRLARYRNLATNPNREATLAESDEAP